MFKRLSILLYYILIASILLSSAFLAHELMGNKLIIIMISLFFLIGILEHFQEIKELEKSHPILVSIEIILGSFLASSITWYINHTLGLGPIVANGLIGVIAAIIFPANLAGAYYAASFVGMSSMGVIPSIFAAGAGGTLAGTIILFSREVYGGIGGKGGTTAAISTQIVRKIVELFL